LQCVSVLVFVTLVAGGCKPHETWRQKLTVVVETPQGEVLGSGVVEVDGAMRQLPVSANEINYMLRGKATVVEVLLGRYLFALLGGGAERVFAAGKDRFPARRQMECLQEIPGQTDPVSLQQDQVPILVTFDDSTRPKTVREVDPEGLAGVFGEGVRLKALTLEITEGAAANGRVEELSGWSCQSASQQLDGDRYRLSGAKFSFASSLNRLDFKGRS
jgi:hypothetical protein